MKYCLLFSFTLFPLFLLANTSLNYADEGGVAVPEMVFVKGGCYQMGDSFGDGNSNENPVHEVCVDDFYIGKYEVTQREWKSAMGSEPSFFKGDSLPVEEVGWNDIQNYLRELNDKTGKVYSLPTEAEWEYACRSGGKKEKFSGSRSAETVGWNARNSGSKTHPVGMKQANGLGLYDMTGNVWEWTQDSYGKTAYSSHLRYNPTHSFRGFLRVIRGGSWLLDRQHARCTHRGYNEAAAISFNVGFRVILRTR